MNAKFEFFVLEKTRTNKAFDLIIILVWSYHLNIWETEAMQKDLWFPGVFRVIKYERWPQMG